MTVAVSSLESWKDFLLTEKKKTSGTYLFDEVDSPDNIQMVDRQIKSATVTKLVERVTYPDYPDPQYLLEFLLTYRSFTTPKQLLRLLVLRFNMPLPAGLSAEDQEKFIASKQKPVQLRVYNVLKNWVDRHWDDFVDTPDLVPMVKGFLIVFVRPTLGKFGDLLLTTVDQMASGTARVGGVVNRPPPEAIQEVTAGMLKGANKITLLDLNPEEVARQMTLHSSALYRELKPWELLGLAWSKNKEKAPHVLEIQKQFNSIGFWVATEVLKPAELKERARVVAHIIEIAVKCRMLNNWDGAFAILAGLSGAAIYRLHKTWAEVPERLLDQMDDINAAKDEHYKTYRDLIRATPPPCVPYLGVYLSDLTAIEENQSKIDGLVNFTKCRLIAGVIQELQQYQATPFVFHEQEALITYILGNFPV